MLIMLNIFKLVYVCYFFVVICFFFGYIFEGSFQYCEKFLCQFYIKFLFVIFRMWQGGGEIVYGRDVFIECCDVVIDDGVGKKSCFVVRVFFRNGIIVLYIFLYEVKVFIYVKFNK